jgi:hypothetical protein
MWSGFSQWNMNQMNRRTCLRTSANIANCAGAGLLGAAWNFHEGTWMEPYFEEWRLHPLSCRSQLPIQKALISCCLDEIAC